MHRARDVKLNSTQWSCCANCRQWCIVVLLSLFKIVMCNCVFNG